MKKISFLVVKILGVLLLVALIYAIMVSVDSKTSICESYNMSHVVIDSEIFCVDEDGTLHYFSNPK